MLRSLRARAFADHGASEQDSSTSNASALEVQARADGRATRRTRRGLRRRSAIMTARVRSLASRSVQALRHLWACLATSSKMRAAIAGIRFDQAGFDAAMEEQRKRAQASWKGGSKSHGQPGLSIAAADGLRGLSQDALHRLRSAGHHQVAGRHRRRRAGAEARRARRDRARPHALLRRCRRTGRRCGLALRRRSQHHRRRSRRRRPIPCRACARIASSPSSPSTSATKSTRWSTTKFAARPCATTPARTCCMPRCAMCWART